MKKTPQPMSMPSEGEGVDIPNALLDDLLSARLPGPALQIASLLMRHTYGADRLRHVTTIPELSKAIDRPQKQVRRALDSLVKKGLVVREKLEGGSYKLGFADRYPPKPSEP